MDEIRVYAGSDLGSISGVVATVATGAGFALGERRTQDGIDYVLALNAGNSSADQGLMMAATLACGVSPYSVTITTVTEAITPANIIGVVQNKTVPTGYYFWMATYGFPVTMRASNISIGTGVPVGPAGNGKVITTNTTGNYVAVNIGDRASATATTDALAVTGRFFFFGSALRQGNHVL